MQSLIAQTLGLKQKPVALLWSDEKPEGAIQFQEGKWGCVMWLFAAAAEGKTAVCDQKTFGCFGGGVGFGFGDQYKNFPGGADCFCRFLSTGNAQSEEGRRTAERVKPFMSEHAHEEFLHGERYIKSPELVGDFIKSTPLTQIPTRYVVLKPLDAVDPARETPQVVVFLADPNQLSALTVLANYGRESCESVIIPFAAGCQAVGVYPYREALAEHPRAVVGLVDISARLQLKKRFGMNLMTFAVPFAMFREMEENVPGSFLERPTWKELVS